MKPYRLFTPGPVNITANMREAVARTDICHREVEFDTLLASVEHKLLSLFEIEQRERYRAVIITGSGTAANEAMLCSVVGEGAILILSNGEFGERLHRTCLIHNPDTHLIETPWGEVIDAEAVATYLLTHRIDVIAMVHHETSSGMLNPLAGIGALAKAHDALFIVDGVSSVGAEPVDMEACGIAFCSSSSSKAIGSYPGLSFVVGLTAEFEKLKHHRARSTYLNLATFYEFMSARSQTPNTPAVPLFYAMEQALTDLLSEGVGNRFATIRARAHKLRRGMERLGLDFLIAEKDMCSVLTTVRMPASIDGTELRRTLREASIIIYEGKGCFRDKVFQVGNIGEISDDDIAFFLHTLELILLKSRMKASNTRAGAMVSQFRVHPLAPVPASDSKKIAKPVLVVS